MAQVTCAADVRIPPTAPQLHGVDLMVSLTPEDLRDVLAWANFNVGWDDGGGLGRFAEALFFAVKKELARQNLDVYDFGAAVHDRFRQDHHYDVNERPFLVIR